MGVFKEMKSEDVWKAVEGHEDVITPELKKEEAFFRNQVCPLCRSSNHQSFVNPSTPFAPGAVLPSKFLRCLACSAEFDPYSRMITKAPTDERG
ncbi:MAG: hypothetical protein E6R04_00505 [Spirochaetes bacterium]|nr:MAG: hypothetical protein E6R04_00505 [Spirochaetota bacterium]